MTLSSVPSQAASRVPDPVSPSTVPARVTPTGFVLTTHPLYLIAQAVTQGIEQPQLLFSPGQTGHDVQLRPLDRQRLRQASFVLWFGHQYEAPLARLLDKQPNAIALLELPAFKRLPLRDTRGQPLANSVDPHLWLEPVNAVAIAHAMAAVRARQYPQFARQYKQNAQLFSSRLMQVARQQQGQETRQPYWAYHDAYQYVEQSLNLQFKGSLTVEHDLPPTLSQLAWLQQQRQQSNIARCLLTEGPVEAAVLKRLQPLRVEVVDEVMLEARDFVTGWLQLTRRIRHCVNG